MKNRTIWLILSCAVVSVLLLGSCAPAPTSTPTTTATVAPTTSAIAPATTPTAGGKWWDKFGTPQYGGIVTVRYAADVQTWDPYYYPSAVSALAIYMEKLTQESNWTLDRKIWSFQTTFTPFEYTAGLLAESWEVPDRQTLMVHIRKGVRWQNIQPVNGREFTAYDVEYHFNRLLGLGGGFTKPSPFLASVVEWQILKSVTATDKYTVVFKSNYPSLDLTDTVFYTISNEIYIAAREAVEKWGDVNDWRRAIGTGPFIVTDYLSGSSITFVKDPNYWGYDERHPENRLPYADGVKALIIPDIQTSLAALRTGKIDWIEGLDWQQSKTLAKTKPELVQMTFPYYANTYEMRVDKAPFTDLRVRTALQMALDFEGIAKNYYGGTALSKPTGFLNTIMKPYDTPYDEWPEDVKQGYVYNPEGAKKLLAEAGYPNGFKTNCVTDAGIDMGLTEIVKSNLHAIGVDMDIKLYDRATWVSIVTPPGKHDAMSARSMGRRSGTWNLPRILSMYTTGYYTNWPHLSDPYYDALYKRFTTALDPEEQKKIIKEGDAYVIKNHLALVLPTPSVYTVYQPWLKGLSAEREHYKMGFYLARAWVDQGVKKAAGH